MEPFFIDFLNRMRALHAEIEKTLEGLPEPALDWKPGADIPSMCIFVTHIAGAERYWIGDMAAGEPSGRDRDAEFEAVGCRSKTILDRLEKEYDYAHDCLSRLSVEDLTRQRVSERDGKPYTVAWALLHALEHTAIHLGHLQIVRQMWDMKDQFNQGE